MPTPAYEYTAGKFSILTRAKRRLVLELESDEPEPVDLSHPVHAFAMLHHMHRRSVTQNFGGARPKTAIKNFFEKIKNFQKFIKFLK